MATPGAEPTAEFGTGHVRLSIRRSDWRRTTRVGTLNNVAEQTVVGTHIGKWALFRDSDDKPLVAKTLSDPGLQLADRRTIFGALERTSGLLAHNGWLALDQAGCLFAAWGHGFSRPGLFVLQKRTKRNSFSIYVAQLDDVPVVLHVAREQGKDPHFAADLAFRRLGELRDFGVERLRVVRQGGRTIVAETSEGGSTGRPHAPWRAEGFDSEIEILVGHKQDLAHAFERLVADRRVWRKQELDALSGKIGEADSELSEAREAASSLARGVSEAPAESAPPAPHTRTRGWLRDLVRFPGQAVAVETVAGTEADRQRSDDDRSGASRRTAQLAVKEAECSLSSARARAHRIGNLDLEDPRPNLFPQRRRRSSGGSPRTSGCRQRSGRLIGSSPSGARWPALGPVGLR